MDKIFAPWRVEYFGKKKGGCLFCDAPKGDDKENLILFRGDKNFMIMNKYPYSPGHIMVSPFRHVTDIEELTDEERKEHFEMIIDSKNLADKEEY